MNDIEQQNSAAALQAAALAIDKISFISDSGMLRVTCHAKNTVNYPQLQAIHAYIAKEVETTVEKVQLDITFPLKQTKQALILCMGFAKHNAPGLVPFFNKCNWHLEESMLHLQVEDAFTFETLSNATGLLELKTFLQQACDITLQLDVGTDQGICFEEKEEKIATDAIEPFQKEIETAPAKKEKKAQVVQKKLKQKRNSTNPAQRVIIGSKLNFKATDDISTIRADSGSARLEGYVISPEIIETRRKSHVILTFGLTDYNGTISVKAYVTKRDGNRAMRCFSRHGKALVRGAVEYDARSRETIVWSKDISWVDKEARVDHAEHKRVELHAHTKMSTLDSVADVKALISAAAHHGHSAIAITDHGVVQAFPDAYMAAKEKDIKLIYGLEAYLVDDACYSGNNQPLDDIVVFDIETTGLDAQEDALTEIACIRIQNGKMTDEFTSFVHPNRSIPHHIQQLTGITDDMVKDAPSEKEVLFQLKEFVGKSILAAHNAWFDVSFISHAAKRHGLSFSNPVLDTLTLSRQLLPRHHRFSLDAVAKYLDITLSQHHRALDDTKATAEILLKLFVLAKEEKEIVMGADLNPIGVADSIPPSHTILLAKNKEGLKQLYALVTASHLDHFYRRPLIPKSLLSKHREHLLVGSACSSGDVYQAILQKKDETRIASLAAFYDYLEIQPVGNNHYLLDNERDGAWIHSIEDLQSINQQIVALAKKQDKPVVATCDIHYVEPHEEYFRRILLTSQGYQDAKEPTPSLYFRTTEEMLEEFSYLGEDIAKEVVIENTNQIAEQIEGGFGPYPDKTHVPVEKDGDITMRNIAYSGAYALYGNPLPEIVEKRLERELGSIIKHGYATLYLAAQRLVQKSIADGYTVGSRGSVGSSFAAFVMGISEVNPLQAHYRCMHCQHSIFDESFAKMVGPDLQGKDCPKCQTPLVKDGYEIPFEVFLGFDGDKVPDIDLNFSGEYQNKAFLHVEEMFGKDNVFRAGTVMTIASKTAYGYVKNYLDDTHTYASRAETDRLIAGIENVKRTTGRHPGGLVVLPEGMDIFEFTPLQYPADKSDADITTHFDYNSLQDRLVKLDILGHDNPTMLRRLYEFTGKDPMDVPLDDPDTLALFTSCKPLGLSEEELGLCMGSLGLPEFGTPFVLGMLDETKPSTVSELIRISGLSHGTDVWINNAQELIKSEIATLNDCICTRDDIMNRLVHDNVEPRMAFNIMERVRKGRGLTSEMESVVKQHHVPGWFIESCKRIKYMFPKAHAAAYVIGALRIGYYKVHHPLAYYAAYFSARAEEFDAEKALGGIAQIDREVKELSSKKGATVRDEKERTHLLIAREMLLRGFEMLPPDVHISEASNFVMEEGKLRLPLSSVQGLGVNAANSVVEARKDGNFMTIDELRERTSLNNTVIERLKNIGTLVDIPESAQVSLFDLSL